MSSIISYASGFPIVPSDTGDQPKNIIAIYVGGAGNVEIITLDGQTLKFSAVPVGTQLEVPPTRRVTAGGTSATLLIGLTG